MAVSAARNRYSPRVKCRSDRIHPWPAKDWPLDGLGTVCQVYVYGKPTKDGIVHPALEVMKEIASHKDREVRGDLRKALGMLTHYSTTDPRQRPVQGRKRPHPWKKEYVKGETGVDVGVLSFGEGMGTQVRIYAVDLDGLPPKVVVLTAYYKRNGDDGWPRVAPILKDLVEGKAGNRG